MPVPEPVRLVVEQDAPVPTAGGPDGPLTPGRSNKQISDALGWPGQWRADKLRCLCPVNVTPAVTGEAGRDRCREREPVATAESLSGERDACCDR